MMIYIGSLKYRPIHRSHCCALGRACVQKGYNVKYLFSKEYEWLLSENDKKKTIFVGNSIDNVSMFKDVLDFRNKRIIREAFSENPPTHVYLQNYHPLNHFIVNLTKKYGAKSIYCVHEPFTKNKRAHGNSQLFYLSIFEYLQGKGGYSCV